MSHNPRDPVTTAVDSVLLFLLFFVVESLRLCTTVLWLFVIVKHGVLLVPCSWHRAEVPGRPKAQVFWRCAKTTGRETRKTCEREEKINKKTADEKTKKKTADSSRTTLSDTV